MCKLISNYQPYIFIAENVKGLLTIDKGMVLKKIIKDFGALGYHIEYKLLNAKDFGVPQNRERIIIIGTKIDILPKFDFGIIDEKKTTLELTPIHAIGDLEFTKEGEFSNHFWSKAKRNNGQGNKAILQNKVAPTIRAEHYGNIEFHWNNTRRLSARECARLQSFPDDFLFSPSTSSAYRQIGKRAFVPN